MLFNYIKYNRYMKINKNIILYNCIEWYYISVKNV